MFCSCISASLNAVSSAQPSSSTNNTPDSTETKTSDAAIPVIEAVANEQQNILPTSSLNAVSSAQPSSSTNNTPDSTETKTSDTAIPVIEAVANEQQNALSSFSLNPVSSIHSPSSTSSKANAVEKKSSDALSKITKKHQQIFSEVIIGSVHAHFEEQQRFTLDMYTAGQAMSLQTEFKYAFLEPEKFIENGLKYTVQQIDVNQNKAEVIFKINEKENDLFVTIYMRKEGDQQFLNYEGSIEDFDNAKETGIALTFK